MTEDENGDKHFKIDLSFDGSFILKAIRVAQEGVFLAMFDDFDALEAELNKNNIDDAEGI